MSNIKPNVHRQRHRRGNQLRHKVNSKTFDENDVIDNNISNISNNNKSNNQPSLVLDKISTLVATPLLEECERQQNVNYREHTNNDDNEITKETVIFLNDREIKNESNTIEKNIDNVEYQSSLKSHHLKSHHHHNHNENNSKYRMKYNNDKIDKKKSNNNDNSFISTLDTMNLRETLEQLPSTLISNRYHRRNQSPHVPNRRIHETTIQDISSHRGILGFMDRELKQTSPTPSTLSFDPTASPGQYTSIRSRNLLEKSPRRKRSKSESRRRRERKIIAAGEMEVRQANETLMRYMKQYSDMNDTSLSGELEIDQSLQDSKIPQQQIKSQKDKKGHIISKLYAGSGLSSILKELSDDIVTVDGDEIYNPFTPVVSPTNDEHAPLHSDNRFMQIPSGGYRPDNDHCYRHKYSSCIHSTLLSNCCNPGQSNRINKNINEGKNNYNKDTIRRSNSNYNDTCCLFDDNYQQRHLIKTNIDFACHLQRIWLMIANICHGFLAGLSLAHLLFIFSMNLTVWSKLFNYLNDEISTTTRETYETQLKDKQYNIQFLQSYLQQQNNIFIENMNTTTTTLTTTTMMPTLHINNNNNNYNELFEIRTILLLQADYMTFFNLYINTFYCLAVVCMVSVLDRMDICRRSFDNTSEFISFRWLIIMMIYMATIILTIGSESIPNKYSSINNILNTTSIQFDSNIMINKYSSSIWTCLSIARCMCAICGWFLIGLTQHDYDLLYNKLIEYSNYNIAK